MTVATNNLGYSKSDSLAELNAVHSMPCAGSNSGCLVVDSVASANMVLTVEGRISADSPWVRLVLCDTDGVDGGGGGGGHAHSQTTGAITTLPTHGWLFGLIGMVEVRVRVSAFTAGALTAAIRLSQGTFS